MKSKLAKKFLVCRLVDSNRFEKYWTEEDREYLELLKVEYFDTEEEAVEYMDGSWSNMTILPVYYRVPDYD